MKQKYEESISPRFVDLLERVAKNPQARERVRADSKFYPDTSRIINKNYLNSVRKLGELSYLVREIEPESAQDFCEKYLADEGRREMFRSTLAELYNLVRDTRTAAVLAFRAFNQTYSGWLDELMVAEWLSLFETTDNSKNYCVWPQELDRLANVDSIIFNNRKVGVVTAFQIKPASFFYLARNWRRERKGFSDNEITSIREKVKAWEQATERTLYYVNTDIVRRQMQTGRLDKKEPLVRATEILDLLGQGEEYERIPANPASVERIQVLLEPYEFFFGAAA